MSRGGLVAALALIVAAAGLWALLTGDGGPGSVDERGAAVSEITVASDAVGQEMPVNVVVPDGAGAGAPLLVFLHGRGGDEDSGLSGAMFAGLDELGDRAPIVAFPAGGGDSFWHDRSDGAWGAYVTEEVIPAVVERFDADPDRVAIGGISMGGFGAYDLARLNPGRFCAAGGHSPALWLTGAETAAGAFDDAEDFTRHDVIAAAGSHPEAFAAQPLWLDIGDEDPFVPGADAFVAALEEAGASLTERRWPGGHDGAYWDSHWGSYLRFYAGALRRCERA